MKKNTLIQSLICGVVVTAMAGCSAMVDPTTGGPQEDVSISVVDYPPDPDMSDNSTVAGPSAEETAALRAEVQRVQGQNVVLRNTQSESAARMEALETDLAEERAANARYREMMETNFNLLEESVARSLANSRGKAPVADRSPANQTLPPVRTLPPPTPLPGAEPLERWEDEVSPGQTTEPVMMPPPPLDSHSQGATADTLPSRPTALETLEPTPPAWSATAPASPGTSSGVVAVVARPAAMGQSRQPRQLLDDPDLQPPAQPITLSAHGAAKPLYEKGFVHFARGDYDASIRTYGEFLDRFPADTHSDNAQFWIAEGYFQLERYDEAETAYRRVLRNYEHRSTLEGFKTPDTIYRLGQIYLTRDDMPRAAYYFNNVIERFPDSTAARKAQLEIDALQLDTASDGLLGIGGTDS